MIVHIAIFKWKKDTNRKKISKLMRNVRKLRGKCKGVIDIRTRKNFSKYSKGFTHTIIVICKNRASLKAYRRHPEHVKIAKEIATMEKDSIGIDFEISLW